MLIAVNVSVAAGHACQIGQPVQAATAQIVATEMTPERGIAGQELQDLIPWLIDRGVFIVPPNATEVWVVHGEGQSNVLVISVIGKCAAAITPVPVQEWHNMIREFESQWRIA